MMKPEGYMEATGVLSRKFAALVYFIRSENLPFPPLC